MSSPVANLEAKPLIRSTPPPEVEMSVSLVRRLLVEQHPDLADLSIVEVESGWDNQMYRLGDELVVRLPRRLSAVECIEREQQWLPRLVPRLPLPAPLALRWGKPGCGYPWPWAVLPWLAGETVNLGRLNTDQWRPWVDFLRALARPAPPDLPASEYRGMPLGQRAHHVAPRLEELWQDGAIGDTDMAIWRRALAAPMDGEPVWLHGDLHQRNVLVRDGRWAAVIDWGDVSAGDWAGDLASIWMLLDSPQSRRSAVAELDEVSEAMWHRAQGWATFFAALFLHTGRVDDARHAAMGEAIFRRLREDIDL